ncbi:MAG: RNA-binding transcriptional accessory protein [Bacteroidales bacterium]|nr:RNA-binding transcriptional accessory protein [Bacteroidales bacterium]
MTQEANLETYVKLISVELAISTESVRNTLMLLDEGATVPFISRYRKERTGGLDEVKIGEIKDLYAKYSEVEARRQTILKTISEQGKLTQELEKQITTTWEMTKLEDLYLPYKPKRKTRAAKARENGLEGLANALILGRLRDVNAEAEKYTNDNVPTAEDALQGARDIIAEIVSEDNNTRDIVRIAFKNTAQLKTKVVKGKETEGDKFSDYFDLAESMTRMPAHRLLAIRRAENEGIIKVQVAPRDKDSAVSRIERNYTRMQNSRSSADQMKLAIEDAYDRLLEPSIETEFSAQTKYDADTEAIRVFRENLRQLLLAAPLGEQRVLALDPGFRTGCKVVCLDRQGALLHHTVVYPHLPKSDVEGTLETLRYLIKKYDIEAVAIGNGTASRETEEVARRIDPTGKLRIFVVSEDGASIYSASKVARDEFPNEDVTVRGAVSIGRRLMDPLAELVKIDPKSIGVGQYQHDVDQTRLKSALDEVVVSCVNSVGVDVNTASKELLTYVSGLGPQLAQNIVDYRAENGAFTSRTQLKKVPRLGAKAYEQCAGFLRIRGAENPLDNSAVHPEVYSIVQQMAKDTRCTVKELMESAEKRKAINIHKYVTETVGLPTLTDIMSELEKPGRDPREKLEEFRFADGVNTIEDLQEGMRLPGIVTNITAFGAFVDIGVHQDGLVHISALSNTFVKDINSVLKLHQHVMVTVVGVDRKRNRISLSMKE